MPCALTDSPRNGRARERQTHEHRAGFLIKNERKIDMKFNEIMTFLDNGLTIEEVQKLIEKENSSKSAANTAAESTPETQPTKAENVVGNDTPETTNSNTEPAWVESLNKSITALTRTMQANALANSQMGVQKNVNEMADEILANIINPKE